MYECKLKYNKTEYREWTVHNNSFPRRQIQDTLNWWNSPQYKNFSNSEQDKSPSYWFINKHILSFISVAVRYSALKGK